MMNTMKTLLLSIIFAMIVYSCGRSVDDIAPVAGEIYVVTPYGKSNEFLTYLASKVRDFEMVPNLGSSTDDKGNITYVLDAANSSVRLRSENVLLSGHEDPVKCGNYSEPHSDPGQYFVSVSPRARSDDPAASREILSKIANFLKDEGYQVSESPILCSELSKIQ